VGLRRVKTFFSILWKTLKTVFFLVLLFAASLLFREQRLPSFVVSRITDAISTKDFLVRCDNAAFGFRHGFRMSGVRVYDMARENSMERPVAVARSIHVNVFASAVRIVEAEYERLPDSYYEPEDENAEWKPEPLVFEVPELPEFRLTLENPSILGVKPERAVATVVSGGGRIVLEDVSVTLPDRDCRTRLAGRFEMDVPAQKARGELWGRVRHAQIMPFLETMDVQSAIPYVAAFTEMREPIPSRMGLEANLTTGDFSMRLELEPAMGRYDGVALDHAKGTVDFSLRNEATNEVTNLRISLSEAVDHQGRRIGGVLTVDNESGRYRVGLDVTSDLAFDDDVRMTPDDLLTPEDFCFMKCYTAPRVTLQGTVATEADDLDANRLAGKFELRHGAFNGFRMDDVEGECSFERDTLNLKFGANGKTGGRIECESQVRFVDFDIDKSWFRAKSKYRGGSLEELADTLKFDLGERDGRVDIDMEASGSTATNSVRTLNGKGSLKITDGHLAQMKLFAGLTELLAEKIPGVSFLVNQTQASADFTIKDGVFISDNVYIEGGLISIKGWGKYDIETDDLDFTVRVQFLKKESLAGRIVHPVTLPFTKLLLEYKVRGPIDDPEWKYIKILDRIF
jgi:hypothetical protein